MLLHDRNLSRGYVRHKNIMDNIKQISRPHRKFEANFQFTFVHFPI